MSESHRFAEAKANTALESGETERALRAWCPKRIEEFELTSKLQSAHGEYYVLKDKRRDAYMMVGDLEVFVWNLLDGAHSVQDIVEAYYQQFAVVAWDQIVRFVKMLEARSMVDGTGRVAKGGVEDKELTTQYKNLAATFIQRKFSLRNVDAVFSSLYARGVKYLYTKPVVIASLLITAFGLILFVSQWESASYSLLGVNDSYLLGIAVLAFWGIVTVFLHECAHAFTLKRYGRKVTECGVMIYYGAFAPFTNTSDAWMLPKWQRIMVSLAGPYVTLAFGSVAAIIIFAFSSELVGSLFFKLSFISFTSVLFNLNPLMEFDGYYALMDYVEIPNLRRRAFQFWRRDLFDKIKKRARLTREEIAFVVYGCLAGIWSFFILCFAIITWVQRIDAYLFPSVSIYPKLIVIVLLFASPLMWRIVKRLRRLLARNPTSRRNLGPYRTVNPLSSWVYIHRNVGKTAPIILIIAFAVFGLSTIGAVGSSAKDTFIRAFDSFRLVTVVQPRNVKDMPVLPSRMVHQIQADPRVAQVIPAVLFSVRLSLVANTSALSSDFPILAVSDSDAKTLMGLMGNRVIAGRLPQARTSEVALAAELVQNHGLELGDTITSSDIQSGEAFVLVGILDGRIPLGLASYAYFRTRLQRFNLPEGVIVIPRSADQLASLSQSLRDTFDVKQVQILDHERADQYIQIMMQGTNAVLAFVILIVAIVIAIQAALLNAIYFGQRTSEYALLTAIGHSKHGLLHRMLKEIAFTSLIGWCIGIFCAYGALHGLEGAFALRGITLDPFAPQPYLSTFSIPALLVLFSIVSMQRQLLRVDPINIIERKSE